MPNVWATVHRVDTAPETPRIGDQRTGWETLLSVLSGGFGTGARPIMGAGLPFWQVQDHPPNGFDYKCNRSDLGLAVVAVTAVVTVVATITRLCLTQHLLMEPEKAFYFLNEL